MKKLLCMALCIVLLGVGSALSEEFSIRNGIKWGDSPETVQRLESITAFDDEKKSEYDDTIVQNAYNSAMVSGHQVKAKFGFKDNKLFCIEYYIPQEYSKEILTAVELKYGQATTLKKIVDTDYYECASNMYTAIIGAFACAMKMVDLEYWWILENGTIIIATSAYHDHPYLVYIDSSTFMPVHNFDGI